MKHLHQQKGLGLIEVMVTVLLLGTSLLALATLQSRSLQKNHSALLGTQANLLAYDILERVRMASPLAPGALVVPSNSNITALVSSVLPEGKGTLECNAARLCTVTVTWSELTRAGDDASEATTNFAYSTQL